MCKDSHFYPHNQIFEAKKYSYIQVFKQDKKVFEKKIDDTVTGVKKDSIDSINLYIILYIIIYNIIYKLLIRENAKMKKPSCPT